LDEEMNGSDLPPVYWAEQSPSARAHRAAFPAQAQVAAWARCLHRPRVGFGRAGPSTARGPVLVELATARGPAARMGRAPPWATRFRRAFGPKYEETKFYFIFFFRSSFDMNLMNLTGIFDKNFRANLSNDILLRNNEIFF
jgi:hypothetical protein